MCAPPSVPDGVGGLYTMEPRNTGSSNLLSACEVRAAAARQFSDDLERIYGGCALCVDDCAAGDAGATPECRAICGLASLADYDAHVAQLTALYSDNERGFADWRRLIEPLPAPPVTREQPLGCSN